MAKDEATFFKENREFSKHHILPRSRHGASKGKNIKIVPVGYHRAYHQLFENLTPDEIRLYMDEVWFSNKPFLPPLNWLKQHKRPH